VAMEAIVVKQTPPDVLWLAGCCRMQALTMSLLQAIFRPTCI